MVLHLCRATCELVSRSFRFAQPTCALPASSGYNLSAHDADDVRDWLQEHPRWTLHFTPTHASWLNQIEYAFSILGKHVLSRGDFDSKETWKTCVHDYRLWFDEQDVPQFEWTFRPASWGQTSSAPENSICA